MCGVVCVCVCVCMWYVWCVASSESADVKEQCHHVNLPPGATNTIHTVMFPHYYSVVVNWNILDELPKRLGQYPGVLHNEAVLLIVSLCVPTQHPHLPQEGKLSPKI